MDASVVDRRHRPTDWTLETAVAGVATGCLPFVLASSMVAAVVVVHVEYCYGWIWLFDLEIYHCPVMLTIRNNLHLYSCSALTTRLAECLPVVLSLPPIVAGDRKRTGSS